MNPVVDLVVDKVFAEPIFYILVYILQPVLACIGNSLYASECVPHMIPSEGRFASSRARDVPRRAINC